jgi:3-hydroxyisobutyrate dehydrogenase-like beta-hydroxyacid dehydrogenase
MERIDSVAFCGLGIMGRPMAAQLVRAGLHVGVYTRSREKTLRIAEEIGAFGATTPAEAAAATQAVVTVLPDAPQVEEVLLGELGAAHELPDGGLVVEMSTIAPTASRSLAERLTAKGLRYVEAPVSGSKPKAEDGTLTIMAGGERADFERALPLFEAMGERIVHVGPVGHGQMAKLLTNTMGAVHAAVLAEAIHVAKAAGLDRDGFLEVAAGSAGASGLLALKGEPIYEQRFEPPLFKLEHMLKDVRHCLEEARALGIELEFGTLAERVYSRADEAGYGELDFAAVFKVLGAAART